MIYILKPLCKKSVLAVFVLFHFGMACSQNDSLFKNSFIELEAGFKKNKTTKSLAIDYAKTYLHKAKEISDTIKIATGYYLFTQIYLSPLSTEGINYCDSIISLTKSIKNNAKFPALGYKEKGRFFFRYGKYKKALDNYITALDHSKSDPLMYETINFNIGLIKNNIEEREEARDIFIRYIDFLETKQNKKPVRSYNLALYALADNYNYTNKLDSANFYIKKGIKNSLKTRDIDSYKYFVLSSGINLTFKRDYNKAKDSLLKANNLFKGNYDQNSHALTKLYLGKCYLALNEDKKAIDNLKSVDSFLQKTKDVSPELLETYNILINYYKAKKDSKNQVYYITELLKFDSILKINHRYISKKIIKSYDVKNLITEKNQKITELNEDKSYSKKTILILFFCIAILLLFIYYSVNKNSVQKKRFNKLLEEYQNKKEDEVKEIYKKEEIKENNRELPKEIVHDILLKLKKFESSNRFTQKKYTLQSLAKELNTNSNYLSKIINESKQVNFPNYLNSLRIDFAINELTINLKFRNYTIKAIAEECGFKTQQSFAAAFYKKTGIKPSYFIKQLNSKKTN